MLTRAQVAKRLGKSIATVRRMEGSLLHPRTDETGVHRFDDSEVDRLALARCSRHPVERRLRSRRISVPKDYKSEPSSWASHVEQREGPQSCDGGHDSFNTPRSPFQTTSNSHEIIQLTERIKSLEEQSATQADHESRIREAERRRLALIAEILDAAEELPDWQLRRLGPEFLELLGVLVGDET